MRMVPAVADLRCGQMHQVRFRPLQAGTRSVALARSKLRSLTAGALVLAFWTAEVRV